MSCGVQILFLSVPLLFNRSKPFKKEDESKLNTREASRAVLFDENNLIPLLFVSKYNHHKLQRGGIDLEEDKEKALIRECLEEIGCEIKILSEVGKIIEYRKEWALKQISYCYLGKIISKGKSNFTEEEIHDGFKVLWVSIQDAISMVEKDKPTIAKETNFSIVYCSFAI